jgi:deazaflavin-dependent oxidoreductase (nitroreductase family)
MDQRIDEALARSQLIDITTTGRKSGEPRRIEIYLHRIDDTLVISGMPRREKRAWIYNLESDPRMTVHLKGPLKADVPATARVITDEAERRAILAGVARAWRRTDVETMVRYSPLIEVTIDPTAELRPAA